MTAHRIITLDELSAFGETKTVNAQAKALVAQQQHNWELAAENYVALKTIQTRTFNFDQFRIDVQFNPGRIRSSAAKTDESSIAQRPCFLCAANLPEPQKGIQLPNNYLVLVNPFPVFPRHLTLPAEKHTPQNIRDHFGSLLDFSAAMPDFTLFYNGPKCGASAPDHFHFQAGTKGFMPLESEFEYLEKNHSSLLFEDKNTRLCAVECHFRRFIAIVSNSRDSIQSHFEKIYQTLASNNHEEPMMNLLCNFMEGRWRLIIFPREKQRPSHFFRTDSTQLVASPAAVELGGILILPRQEDFEKITKKEVQEIYDEVVIKKERFMHLKQLRLNS